MHFPHFMRRVNRVFTNPLMMTFAGVVPPLAIVHHVGRKSGKRYRTPVVAFPTEKGFAIPSGRATASSTSCTTRSSCRSTARLPPSASMSGTWSRW